MQHSPVFAAQPKERHGRDATDRCHDTIHPMIKQLGGRVHVHSNSFSLSAVHCVGRLITPDQCRRQRVEPVSELFVLVLLRTIDAALVPHHPVEDENQGEARDGDQVGRPFHRQVRSTGGPQRVNVGRKKGGIWPG